MDPQDPSPQEPEIRQSDTPTPLAEQFTPQDAPHSSTPLSQNPMSSPYPTANTYNTYTPPRPPRNVRAIVRASIVMILLFLAGAAIILFSSHRSLTPDPTATVGLGTPTATVGPGTPTATVGPGTPTATVGPGTPAPTVGPGTPTAITSPTFTPTVGVTPTAPPTYTTVDDAVQGTGENEFNYTGHWLHYTGLPDVYDGTLSRSLLTGATASIAFTGTEIQLYATRGPDLGFAGYRLDGGPEVEVDQYASIKLVNRVLYDSGKLARGNHTLEILFTGLKNANSSDYQVTVDDVVITS